MNAMSYRAVPELNQLNLMIFLLNWGKGCFKNTTLGEAFAYEFDYQADHHPKFTLEQDTIITLKHIEKLMREIS